jgi:hypothetical protein
MNAFLAIVVNLFAVIAYVWVCIMLMSYGTGTSKAVKPRVGTAVRAVGVGMLVLGFIWLST